MCSSVNARFLRALSIGSVLAFSGLLMACSNDASRFDDVLGDAQINATQNVAAVGDANQAYPGDVDQITTASVSRQSQNVVNAQSQRYNQVRVFKPNRIVPSTGVVGSGARQLQSMNSTYSSVKQAQQNIQVSKPAAVYAPAARSISTTRYQNPVTRAPLKQITVSKPKLVAPSIKRPASGSQLVLSPRNTLPTKLRMASTDEITTGSIRRAVTAKVKNATPAAGWKGAGGSWVNIKPGETLYNLSRRYGVPVKDLMAANSLTDANGLTAGKKILIPAYTYHRTSGVSAPDSNPMTKASRASKGFFGDVGNGRVAVPTARVQRTVKAPAPAVVKHDQVITGSVPAAKSSDARANLTTRGKPKFTSPADSLTIANRATEKVSTPNKTSSGSFRWPTKGRVIANFGQRVNGATNDGIDISVPIGSPVKATENGTVIYSGSELADFGNLILVSHSGGWVSAYAHSSQNKVRRGDKVSRGQVIAISGKSGNAKRPKLHFELRKNSTPVNPLKHLGKS